MNLRLPTIFLAAACLIGTALNSLFITSHAYATEDVDSYGRFIEVLDRVPRPLLHEERSLITIYYQDLKTLSSLLPGGVIDQPEMGVEHPNPETGEMETSLILRPALRIFERASPLQSSEDSIGIPWSKISAISYALVGEHFNDPVIVLYGGSKLSDYTNKVSETIESYGYQARDVDGYEVLFNFSNDEVDMSRKPIGPVLNNPFTTLGGRGPVRLLVLPDSIIGTHNWTMAGVYTRLVSGNGAAFTDLEFALELLSPLKELVQESHELVQLRMSINVTPQGQLLDGSVIADLQRGSEKVAVWINVYETQSRARETMKEMVADQTWPSDAKEEYLQNVRYFPISGIGTYGVVIQQIDESPGLFSWEPNMVFHNLTQAQ